MSLTGDQNITLNLQVHNDREIKDLSDKLAAAKELLGDVEAQFKSGYLTADQYKAGVKHLNAEIKDLEKQLKAAGTAASATQSWIVDTSAKMGEGVKKGTKEAGAGFGDMSNKLQVFGQGLDDLQYVAEQGLRPIIGNLMQMSPIIGIAAIGVNLLWNNWDKLGDLLGEGHTETEAERMERLEKATNRTVEETRELNKHKRIQGDIEAAIAAQSKEQKEAASGVSGVLGVVGGEQAVKDLTAALIAMDKSITPDSNPDWVASHTEALRHQAEALYGAASAGNIQAANAIRETLTGTNAGRNSVTGQTLAQGDADVRRKAVAAEEQKVLDAEKARLQAEASKHADDLGSRHGGMYAGRLGDRPVEAITRDLVESGVTEELAGKIAGDVLIKMRDKMDAKIRAYAIQHGVSLNEAEYRLQGKATEGTENPLDKQGSNVDPMDAVRAAAKKTAEANAKLFGGGKGGMMEQGEAFMAAQAQARAQANSLPRGPRAAFIRDRERRGDPILSAEEAGIRVWQVFERQLEGKKGIDGGVLSPSQRQAAAHEMMRDIQANQANRMVAPVAVPPAQAPAFHHMEAANAVTLGRRKGGGMRSVGVGPAAPAAPAAPMVGALQQQQAATAGIQVNQELMAGELNALKQGYAQLMQGNRAVNTLLRRGR